MFWSSLPGGEDAIYDCRLVLIVITKLKDFSVAYAEKVAMSRKRYNVVVYYYKPPQQ